MFVDMQVSRVAVAARFCSADKEERSTTVFFNELIRDALSTPNLPLASAVNYSI